VITLAVVLVFTNSADGSHTDVVIEKIIEQGSAVIRFDTDEISSGNHRLLCGLDSSITLTTPTAEYNLQDANSVWLRRPRVFDFAVNDPVQRIHTENEFKTFLAGIYVILGDKRWLNTPQAIERAKLKAYQLKLAKELGFQVPDSVITASPEVARQFCAQGLTVFKPLAQSNIGGGGKALLIPTTLLTDKHLERLDLIRNQYVLLQRYIKKHYELRITFVDGELFVAKQVPTDNLSASVADWRLLQINRGSAYEPFHVSEELECKIKDLVRKLNLNFAALDFAVDLKGNHYFLEINPNGQWFGYTDAIGMPASSAIARFLTNPGY
jgi:glutathione synthase/RimK-type ligase-like ATP-grasp enzyme